MTAQVAQQLLLPADERAALCAPLGRPMARAWDDLPAAWRALASGLRAHEQQICAAVDADACNHAVVPARPFRAFELVAPDHVRLILVGQDPYPLPGDATGLAFSSLRGIPASMRNVYAAIEQALPGFQRPPTASLEHWAGQGVLLLNTALTVRMGPKMAGTHLRFGWQQWTAGVLRALYGQRLAAGAELPVAWLWGKPAREFFESAVAGLDLPPGRVLVARHPSQDFRREFVGQAQVHLQQLGRLLHPPIRW
ncbi:MAG: ung [Ramlibacter sp.]|uniref:uracil-DNA glycosylase n=1 Tax=Ramlibacter sp. TaxID=1917967 RepID=UPI002619A559|nr:uracil-DNA glycosylase [Ramlibacter sp.]MDB5752652.1 ung [Ramlibacter sp.]